MFEVGRGGSRVDLVLPQVVRDGLVVSGDDCLVRPDDSWLNWPSFGLPPDGFRDWGVQCRAVPQWARSSNHGGTALVHVIELLAVLRGFALVLDLRSHGWRARTAEGCNLRWLWSHSKTASPSVVRDASVVIHDDGAVVDVGDVDDVNAVDCAVVVEVISVPVAAVVAEAGIAEAVVNTAIETDVQAPVAAEEAPAVMIPAPIAWGPEGSIVRWSAPCTGNPIIAGRRPVPIAWRPEVVRCGGFGLLIFGERWRRLIGILNGCRLTLCIELLCGPAHLDRPGPDQVVAGEQSVAARAPGGRKHIAQRSVDVVIANDRLRARHPERRLRLVAAGCCPLAPCWRLQGPGRSCQL